MGNDKLSVTEALKYARHDFLNELQLILSYIDLGKIPNAKEKIMESTENMRQIAMLERLGLPALESWLATFGWMYNSFSAKMTCEITSGIRQTDDGEVVSYLNRVFKDAVKAVEPTLEYEANLTVTASSTSWSITIIIKGALNNKQPAPETTGSFTVDETILNNQWTFMISGR
ncbi:Spo0B domain-containing protein [Sporosarcina limicola]|uniref:Stage 0 sporulation protein B (Sporulation initiation phosphotransferase) n=1 Tax=Sporosarcina limicola TaxID=34101 RepID=A0A927MH41_9BACL|nr:Spo0B domain-containing protein [Sporosarcina limicola]MBE1554584.1 stage 0 sporulation protein B (sporulation initiation phosphotransferase) [Sporosarcina limicola]